jgi:hypothetical protein
MADGTVIEILPKIAGGDISVGDTKRIFLEMLKTLKDVDIQGLQRVAPAHRPVKPA